jgi:hypothetical protein
LEGLPPDQQARITAVVAAAPELSDRQRQRLELMFRATTGEAGDDT